MTKRTLEAVIDKIGKNGAYCLETLSMDIDNLENASDFVHSVKRKANVDPCATPVKRRRISKKHLIDAARVAEEEKAKEQAAAKKAKVMSAKAFISDQAEEDDGEEDAEDGRIISRQGAAFARANL